MSELHQPVLKDEVIKAFMEQPRPPTRLFEGTFGRGGHTKILLESLPLVSVVSFDKDEAAAGYAKEKFSTFIERKRLSVIHDDFKNFEVHKLGLFDGALINLGVSSPQLDNAERGFSFMNDGPLDMRMDRRQKFTAQNIVNEYAEKDLSDLFYNLGEVRRPNRVVRAIVHDRKKKPFTSTRELASLIERVDKGRRGHHAATNYFLALRLAVNQELEGLERFIESMPLNLEPGSRFVVISFHSLEDRVVKFAFKRMNKKFGKIINKKVIIAKAEELKENPRARSAKMRVFEMGE